MWPLLAVWLLGGVAPPGTELLVSAAVSMTEALTECGRAFTNAKGIPVRFNFGASNALARQIVQGARADVFVSADVAQMQLAEKNGAIAPGTVAVVSTNRLVIVVPGAGGPRWADAAPLGGTAVRRIAIGDPKAVPAGVYARIWLRRIGLWDEVESKLVPAASVRGALAAVRTGAADAGIVYRTDAPTAAGISVAFEASGADAPDIEYPAAVVARSRNAEGARAFLDFLRGAAARRILQRHGFGVPADSILR